MEHTDVLDWRVWKAAVVASATPGPLKVKPGDHIYVMTSLKSSLLSDISFVTPGPTALALSSAITSARAAELTLGRIKLSLAAKPRVGPQITDAELAHLYSYLEQSMTAAVFSFQALESYANQVIAESLEGTLSLKRTKGTVTWTAAEIERNCSTEEKLGVIVGQLFGKQTPKGSKPWQGFVKLKSTRDATIHLKSPDQYVRGAPDKQTLYYQLLNNRPVEYPRWSIALLRYFAGKATWLDGAEAALGSPLPAV